MEEPVLRSNELDEKYDLTKNAYVLVLHHYTYSDSMYKARKGSEVDMEKIKKFFRSYRTDPEHLAVHENLPLQQVELLMDDVSRKDFTSNSCLIVIIMSHGGQHDAIIAHDGATYYLTKGVLEKVAANPTLDGKPKVFIVNACRGVQSVARQIISVPDPDTVIFQSTYEGHESYRNERTGSFFVQTFFDLLRENDHLNIYELNAMLNKRSEKQKYIQNPTMTSTLRNRMIFQDLRKEGEHITPLGKKMRNE